MPCVAVQFGGSAGGVTPSKFSRNSGGQEGVAVAVAVAVGVALGDPLGAHAEGVPVGVGIGVGLGPPRLNAPIRNLHPMELVEGTYSLTTQNVVSSTGSMSI